MKRIFTIALLSLLVAGCDSELEAIHEQNKNQWKKDVLENVAPQEKQPKQFLLIDTDERGRVTRYYDSQIGVVCYRYNGTLSCVKMAEGKNL